ncbi:MAG: class I SAM-dependent methyltransferase [Symploca sp. SIO3C6]|uniref:Class I SAM-dependent methyltransferase n=1 Tax=Symploca sp. SIO1C4 TaxID=2607765 RepID=A0A6B3N8I7_9CYAN|nr:class I SAM-dependent methyltransferase [Symploca sp. SIO3C6]NER26932.1 class I SAM-dependent methyltransferase [Symploca sp. SIO1C4]NET07886.1 class I SAM-dependent methyltransferase [Symploca sp. SIO2B6]
MQTITHWTPRYLANRISLAIYEKQHPDHPWLTQSAISILSNYLKKSDIGLEWGSGRSTAWFAARIKYLVSVEDNYEWYQIVRKKLDHLNLNNTHYLLATDRESYIGAADNFQDDSLDFVLVDGRHHRNTCAVKAVSKVKTGGVIVLDNANRFLPSNSHSPNSRTYETGPASDEWQHFLDLVKDWRRIWTSNGVSDTAFFIKVS